MRIAAGLILSGILGMGAQGSTQAPAQAPAKPKTSSTAKKAPAAKAGVTRAYDRTLLRPALLKEKAPETYDVKFATSKGDFTLAVTRAWAPVGADRFYNLVKHHYYDGASFFRVLPGFVVQWGISPYPAVSAAWSKATIHDDPVTQSNLKGYITFATGGANTRTTQVFINLADNKRLDSMGFSAFGKVTDGMSVIESLYGDYGDGPPQGGGPDQSQIEAQGKAYLDKGWPQLDYIKTATISGLAVAARPQTNSTAKPKPTAKPAPSSAKPK